LKQIQSGQPPAATYSQVCLKLGVLEDDGEWQQAMQEAVHMPFPPTDNTTSLCIILEWCNPSDPSALFHKFKEGMAEDYQRMYNDKPEFSSNIKDAMLVLNVQQRLNDRNIALQNDDFLNTTQEFREKCTTFNDKLHRSQEEQQSPYQLQLISLLHRRRKSCL
jgi:hypothetical protein